METNALITLWLVFIKFYITGLGNLLLWFDQMQN